MATKEGQGHIKGPIWFYDVHLGREGKGSLFQWHTYRDGKQKDESSHFNLNTEMKEEKLQTSVLGHCYCFLVEYLAVAGLMNF